MNNLILKATLIAVLFDVFWSLWLIVTLVLLAALPVFGLYHINYTVYMTWLSVKTPFTAGLFMAGIFIWVHPFKSHRKGTN